MVSSLSNLVNNHPEGTHERKCKDSFLEDKSIKDILIKYKCHKDYLAIKIIQTNLIKNGKVTQEHI